MVAVTTRVVGIDEVAEPNGSSYTAFVLVCAAAGRTWRCQKRYSEFDDLRKAVSKDAPPLASAFPGKSLFGKMSPQQTERRGEALEAWLNELAGMIMVSAAVQAHLDAFLEAPSETVAPEEVVVEATAAPPPLEGGAATVAPVERGSPVPPATAYSSPSTAAAASSTWDAGFMSHDPLAGLSLSAPPTPAPPPRASSSSSSSSSSTAASSSTSPAPPPPPAAVGVAPAFLLGAAARSYPQTGEGLRSAVKAKDVAGVRTILGRNPSLASFQDRQMESMLHLAAIFNHGDIALELVKAGADVTLKNQDKETPLDVALPSLKAKIEAEVAKRAA